MPRFMLGSKVRDYASRPACMWENISSIKCNIMPRDQLACGKIYNRIKFTIYMVLPIQSYTYLYIQFNVFDSDEAKRQSNKSDLKFLLFTIPFLLEVSLYLITTLGGQCGDEWAGGG